MELKFMELDGKMIEYREISPAAARLKQFVLSKEKNLTAMRVKLGLAHGTFMHSVRKEPQKSVLLAIKEKYPDLDINYIFMGK
jgi:hypothetical protein